MSYPVGRSRLEAALVLGAALLGAAGLAGWAGQAARGAAAAGLAGAVAVALVAAAWQGWRRTPLRQLAWDGQGWLLDGQALARVDCIADLQGSLLLRCRTAAGRATWLWPERRADPVHWADLRRAVYSRAKTETPSREPRGTAEP